MPHRLSAAILGLATISCESVEVKPSLLASLSGDRIADPDGVSQVALANWKESIDLMNSFLVSDFNRSLPRGEFRFNDDVLEFLADGVVRKIYIRCSTWGDVVLCIGGKAQAVSDGINVGARGGDGHRAIYNSLFFHGDGRPRDAESIAATILHETGHIVHECGTVGFCNGTLYFLEAIFLLRAASHSAERRPRATSEEFFYFNFCGSAGSAEHKSWVRGDFEEHLREDRRGMCEHGPYGEG